MKKQTITTLLIAGCICLLQSCAWRPCTTLNVYGGPDYSMITSPEGNSWTGALGLQVGADAQIPYNSQVPISSWAGIQISMQGARWEDDWGEGLTKGITRLWYLNVPLVTRYEFGNGFFAEAGLQPGFLLSAKDKYGDYSYNYKEYVKTFDLGIPLGIGYEFPNSFGVGLRVTPGVTNINAGDYADYTDRNLVIGIRGTYTIPGK